MENAVARGNRSALLAELKACSSSRNLLRAKLAHEAAIAGGDDADLLVANTLVGMYVKCRSITEAQAVFDGIHQRDVVSWNSLIFGYAENGQGEEALAMFARMQESCSPNALTFVAALKACTSLVTNDNAGWESAREKGMVVHSHAVSSGLEADIRLANTLVDLYSKCRSIIDARKVFDRMEDHTVVSWTALILGYAANGDSEAALSIFSCMRAENTFAPDAVTVAAALKACAELKDLDKGMDLHYLAACNSLDDMYVTSSLIHMYAKCRSMADAQNVFERMPGPNVVAWNALLFGYVENGDAETALDVFSSAACSPNNVTLLAVLKAISDSAVKEEGTFVSGKLVRVRSLAKGMAIHARNNRSSDVRILNTLIDMYGRCGSMDRACSVFESIRERTVVSWNALIFGYVENGEGDVALELYCRMKLEGSVSPDVLTFVAALKACGIVGALEVGRRLHVDIVECGFQKNLSLVTSLMDFYGKCGDMVEAERIFESLFTKDLITWSALMAGHSRNSNTGRVLELFRKMERENVQPDGVTFQSVLSACGHAGLVAQGRMYFELMCSRYSIKPDMEHYQCMVDIFGRANRLDEAVSMLRSMPLEPNVVTWTAVLSACRSWKNAELGKLAFESLLSLEYNESAAYATMADIYASKGMLEEKLAIDTVRIHARAWNKPEQSWWTNETGIIHTFKTSSRTSV